ncbi:MAG: glycosyltransferase family 2 protein [Lachnospiraceae bacterium]|nr:glycosyltransferase family 2 protein [Lachnospiraceae bacterium]
MKLVTVCICVYNGEKYIIETLESITKQTYKDFDLLIVDDASTDNGIKIAEKFLAERAEFSWSIYHLKENGGLARARRFAEEHINTKYIMFFDADDIMLPNMLERLVFEINGDDDLIAVGCYLDYIDAEGKKLVGGLYIGAKTKEEFFEKAKAEKLIFMHPSTIFDREAALSVGGRNVSGFPEGKPYYQDMCEDCDLWTRMSDLYINGKAMIVIPEVLAYYRKMDNTMSTNTRAMKLRMLHIKRNLKLRRQGKPEIAFINFENTLSKKGKQEA